MRRELRGCAQWLHLIQDIEVVFLIEQIETAEPRAEYRQRREERQVRAEALARTERAFSNARLAVFALGVLMAWLAFHDQLFTGWLLVLPIGGYLALAARHDAVIQARKQAERAVQFYDSGLRRLDHRWQGGGNSGARFLKAEHPYAIDLDILGRASLFELLCTARTQGGEACLAGWLLEPATPAVIRARQQAVEELRPRLDLREDLAILGEQVRGAIRPEILVEWGEQPPTWFAPWERGLITLLAVGAVGLALYWAIGHNPLPFTIVFTIEQIYFLTLRSRLSRVTGAVEKPLQELALFVLLLARIERESMQSPRMRELYALLDTAPNIPGAYHRPPSVRIARLERLVELLQIPNNQLLKLFDLVMQFSTFVTFGIEDWRHSNGPHIAAWIQAVAEFEALASLAGYAYENPSDTFPEIMENEGGRWASGVGRLGVENHSDPYPEIIESDSSKNCNSDSGINDSGINDSGINDSERDDGDEASDGGEITVRGGEILLDAVGMAHPLLPVESAVRNDLRFTTAQRLYIVSGSNMSGKSTLMRALGVNVVLAQTGAPVRAHRLRLTPLRIGASIRTQDSLEAGISRFYAEILRLRQIVDMTPEGLSDSPPLLFLLDEILHGTNSHDRRVGAEAVVRALLAHNALGLVTTHDLALAHIAEEPTLHATNVHLQDQLTDGKMTFDYHLRPGVVTRSNAIELMRAVGLDV